MALLNKQMNNQTIKLTNRLNVVLDLDHTLLHTTKKNRIHPNCTTEDIHDLHEIHIEGDDVYYVKFRPGIVQFLEKIRGLFDIHVYTMGTRCYAKAIIETIVYRLMDGVSVFNGKIFTRCDTGRDEKYLSFILPGLEHRTVILDDSPNVWKDFKYHVIPIYPYKFFRDVQVNETSDVMMDIKKNMGKENNPQVNRDKNCLKVISPIVDTHLHSMYQVLVAVHRNYYFRHPTQPGYVSESLKWRRKKVFQGVNILFTGVFPLGTNPKEQPLWKQAEHFGAQCFSQFNDTITHLVAARNGTDKVLEAQRRGNIQIVTLNWLYDSLAHWIRLPENDYRLS